MGRRYCQLCIEERVLIGLLQKEGHSLRMIARHLGRCVSTVSRELRRNSKPTKQWPGGYKPARAHDLALRRRRWDARFKLARQPELRRHVRDRLAMGWSPEQIAGRLALEHAHTVISHESIYRYIYYRSAQKDYWHRLLPRAKHRRGRLRKRGASPVTRIKHRTSVHERPDDADRREQPGHWEADLMLFRKYGQAVLVAHERLSRFTHLSRQPNKQAKPVVKALSSLLAPLPQGLRRSITFDNGTEFFEHHTLTSSLAMQTFFCDPYCPWQKGGVENAIGRIRRTLPSKADLAAVTDTTLEAIVRRYNDTPRKCLNFRTPHEVFCDMINSVALQP